MDRDLEQPISGHVSRVEGKRGPVWYAKYRLPDGRQVKRKIGPAWTSRGRPAAGYFTKRTAQGWLDEVLAEARRGTLRGMVRTGATFADAAGEWLRWCEHERDCKPSTLADYRTTARTLNRDLGELRIEDVTGRTIEEWLAARPGTNTTKLKYLVILHGIFRRAMRVWGLPRNPTDDIDRPRVRISDDIDAFSPEEVRALVRAAATPLDATLFLTAAFTGLRLGELLALRWRDVDFTGQAIRVRRSYTLHGGISTPKSGKVRSVPLVDEVARAIAKLGDREHWTGEDDLVFAGPLGGFQDGQALRKRYKAALREVGLRELRLHDLRHTFGTLAIERASILQVKAWMGHSAVQTTMRYLHHKSRRDEARLLEEAFAAPGPDALSVRA